jgi:hypothetical protein
LKSKYLSFFLPARRVFRYAGMDVIKRKQEQILIISASVIRSLPLPALILV